MKNSQDNKSKHKFHKQNKLFKVILQVKLYKITIINNKKIITMIKEKI